MRRGKNTNDMIMRVAMRRIVDNLSRKGAAEDINPLDGMDKRKAVNWINKLIAPLAKGLFKDESWRPVKDIFDTMSHMGVEWVLQKAEYRKDNQGNPNSKEWKFDVYFVDKKGKKITLYGVIVASGAGSVSNPLEKYDVVAYVS